MADAITIAVTDDDRRRRRLLRLLVTPLALWFVAFSVAVAFAPALVDRSPEALVLLAPLTRHLLLVSPALDSTHFFVLGMLGCTLPDPFCYALGRNFGQDAIRWIEMRSFGRLIRWTERAFRRAAPVVLFLAPGPFVNLLAGATGMRVHAWAALNLAGTITMLVVIRLSGAALSEPIASAREFIETNVLLLTIVSAAAVTLGALVRHRRIRIARRAERADSFVE